MKVNVTRLGCARGRDFLVSFCFAPERVSSRTRVLGAVDEPPSQEADGAIGSLATLGWSQRLRGLPKPKPSGQKVSKIRARVILIPAPNGRKFTVREKPIDSI